MQVIVHSWILIQVEEDDHDLVQVIIHRDFVHLGTLTKKNDAYGFGVVLLQCKALLFVIEFCIIV